jgi:hypothetical protein
MGRAGEHSVDRWRDAGTASWERRRQAIRPPFQGDLIGNQPRAKALSYGLLPLRGILSSVPQQQRQIHSDRVVAPVSERHQLAFHEIDV